MKVYIVNEISGEDIFRDCVFATENLAKNYCAWKNEHEGSEWCRWSVEEIEVLMKMPNEREMWSDYGNKSDAEEEGI